MNSRELAHAENERAFSDLLKGARYALLMWIVAGLAVGVMASLLLGYINRHDNEQTLHLAQQVQVIAQKAQENADKARVLAQAQCSFDELVADAPVPTTVNELGLRISAAARNAYAKAECVPKLTTTADPRIVPFLDSGVS